MMSLCLRRNFVSIAAYALVVYPASDLADRKSIKLYILPFRVHVDAFVLRFPVPEVLALLYGESSRGSSTCCRH